jgi:hypothetical protein
MVPMNSYASPVISPSSSVTSVGHPFLEFGRRLLGERERENVRRLALVELQDLDDPL